jgi:lysophospholipase L1-like esterase
MPDVPASATGSLITLTIGGNDLLAGQDKFEAEGLSSFAAEHLNLLKRIRAANPDAFLMVGNIYAPQTRLPDHLAKALDEANSIIAANVKAVGARLADIHDAFLGHEQEYLCLEIEPNLKGATVITSLFKELVVQGGGI